MNYNPKAVPYSDKYTELVEAVYTAVRLLFLIFPHFVFFFSPLLLLFLIFYYFLFHSYLRFKPNIHMYICQSVFLVVSVFYFLLFLWIETKSETIVHPGLVKRVTAVINLPGDARKDNVAQDSKFSQVEKYICVNRGAFCSRWTIYLNLSENHN